MACVTTAKAGCGGSIDGPDGAEVRKWDVTVSQELLDVTSFASDCWRTFIGGVKSGTGSYEGVGAALPSIGSTANAIFLVGVTEVFKGDILISDVNVVTDVGAEVVYNATFSFCGAIV